MKPSASTLFFCINTKGALCLTDGDHSTFASLMENAELLFLRTHNTLCLNGRKI